MKAYNATDFSIAVSPLVKLLSHPCNFGTSPIPAVAPSAQFRHVGLQDGCHISFGGSALASGRKLAHQ
jgi:hypothetical protein